MGNAEYGLALARPNEAPQHLQAATQRFDDAVPRSHRRPSAPRRPGQGPSARRRRNAFGRIRMARPGRTAIWRRCSCARASSKKPRPQIEPLVTDPGVGEEPVSRRWRSITSGMRISRCKDYAVGGPTLSQLAPFDQDFGIHARYLLARRTICRASAPKRPWITRPSLAAYDEHKKAAQAALQNPAKLSPERKAALEALVNGPPPDYVARTVFYTNVLLAEPGKFTDALTGVHRDPPAEPQAALCAEAQLRAGFCQLQLKNYPEALRSLEPLREHPQWSDQALWWIARARSARPIPTTPLLTPRRSILRWTRFAGRRRKPPSPRPKIRTPPLRRGDILMDLADAQQLAKQYREAAATYQQILAEKINPQRSEEAMQRQITALHLAGQYPRIRRPGPEIPGRPTPRARSWAKFFSAGRKAPT